MSSFYKIFEQLENSSYGNISLKKYVDEIRATMECSQTLNETYISPHDFKAVAKKMTDKPNDSSEWGKGFRNIMNRMKRKQEDVSLDDLISQWRSKGSPTDLDELIDILKDNGFSRGLILRTMRKLYIDSSTGSSPAIDRLAKTLKDNNIEEPIIDYLSQRVKLDESVLYENKMSDNGIKKLFRSLIDYRKSHSDDSINTNYMKKWGKEFNQSAPIKKVELAIEMINHLADRKGTTEHKTLSSIFKKVLTRSELPDYIKKSMINDVNSFSQYNKVKIAPNGEMDRNWWYGIKPEVEKKRQEIVDRRKPVSPPSTYLNDWARQFNDANIQGKLRLGKEITNYLADRYGQSGHDDIVNFVSKVIRNSQLGYLMKKSILDRIKEGRHFPMKESFGDEEVLERAFSAFMESIEINK